MECGAHFMCLANTHAQRGEQTKTAGANIQNKGNRIVRLGGRDTCRLRIMKKAAQVVANVHTLWYVSRFKTTSSAVQRNPHHANCLRRPLLAFRTFHWVVSRLPPVSATFPIVRWNFDANKVKLKNAHKSKMHSLLCLSCQFNCRPFQCAKHTFASVYHSRWCACLSKNFFFRSPDSPVRTVIFRLAHRDAIILKFYYQFCV